MLKRNLAVGEVNSAPYKIEMDLPKIFKEQAREAGTAKPILTLII